MPKHSQNPGNNNPQKIDLKAVEQLNRAVDAMFARVDGNGAKLAASVEPLARIAATLHDLPRENFKTKLKAELLKPAEPRSNETKEKEVRRKSMSTVAEPVATAHTTAAPRIVFKDTAKAIEFYKSALGAKEVMRFDTPTGIPHAEIRVGDSTLLLADEWPEGGRFSAETLGHSPIHLSLQVADVDSFAARAVAAGLKNTIPIRDQFYGRREGTFVDPFGYTWSISTLKEEMSIEEMHRRMAGLMQGPEGGKMPAHDEATHETKVSPVPRGYRMVTPYLVAEDGLGLLEFAKQGIGAEETFRAMTATGVHSEVRIGDSMLMIGGGLPGVKFPATLHPNALHVYVNDVDAVYKNALAAGATSITEPRDQEYGERGASLKDQAGNFWYIATRLTGNYKWEGAPDVQPYLHPVRVEPVIGFLKRAFGAEEVGPRYASPDGVVHHMSFKIGDSHLEMGEAQGPYQPMPAMFYLYVPDCDALYRRALAAGATSLHELTDQPYGDRSGAVRDIFGNTWYIATHIKDM